MRERGHRIVIVAQPDSGILSKASEHGFETVPLSFSRKDWPVTLTRLLKLYKQIRPDVVNTHSSNDSWVAGIATRLSSLRPILIRTRHLSTPVSTGLQNTVLYQYLPHRITTTGQAIREQLMERNRIPAEQILSIPTGVDLKQFDPTAPFKDIREALSLAPDTPLVGTVSVLRSWKGHRYLIDAAHQIKDAFPQTRFLIVGDGPIRADLEENIRERGLANTVLMTGHREDISDIIASLDILVHPSYANEGIPQTLLQGLAMETPIISSDLKPQLEVIKHRETGLVVPMKDSQALAQAISTLLQDPDLRKTLTSQGRDWVQQFSKERMLDLTEEMYRTLAKQT